MEFDNSLKEFDWALKVLKSVESENQINCAYNCFLLWCEKYSDIHQKDLSKLKSIYIKNYKSKLRDYYGAVNI